MGIVPLRTKAFGLVPFLIAHLNGTAIGSFFREARVKPIFLTRLCWRAFQTVVSRIMEYPGKRLLLLDEATYYAVKLRKITSLRADRCETHMSQDLWCPSYSRITGPIRGWTVPEIIPVALATKNSLLRTGKRNVVRPKAFAPPSHA